MEKRKVESLNAEVSLLGFGLMRLPVIAGDSAKIDYPKAKRLIDRAYKAGVNYFDTAWPYHGRTSEIFAGDVLSTYPRESYYLADKMPAWEKFNSESDLEAIFNEQLKKCRTSYFDFYLAHSLNQETMENLKNHIYGFLRKKKEEGKILRLGFSFHDNPDLLREIITTYEWDFAQIQVNYLDWETAYARSFYEVAAEHKLPVVIMEPVKGGTLANLSGRPRDILEKANPDSSQASWALRFAASLPNVMTVLSGMSNLEQLEDNLKTFSPLKPVSREECKVLEEVSRVFHSSGTVPCTGCRYCADCPSSVDIPRILAHYNHYLLAKSKINFANQYQGVKRSSQAHNCVNCGECVKLCPQGIDIPKYLAEISSLFSA